VAVLWAAIVFFGITVPRLLPTPLPMPPPYFAEFPQTVLLAIVTVPR